MFLPSLKTYCCSIIMLAVTDAWISFRKGGRGEKTNNNNKKISKYCCDIIIYFLTVLYAFLCFFFLNLKASVVTVLRSIELLLHLVKSIAQMTLHAQIQSQPLHLPFSL